MGATPRRFDHLNHRTEYEQAADEAARAKVLARWLEASHIHLEAAMEQHADETRAALAKQADETRAALAKQADETRRALTDFGKRFDDRIDRNTEAILAVHEALRDTTQSLHSEFQELHRSVHSLQRWMIGLLMGLVGLYGASNIIRWLFGDLAG